ncbi:DUF4350 domain-containing protein [Fodinibacter luteus]|uniref:DUF4350 domain-containing protein n=1 Tax=Fodinibacter luteus TaxID=552064 RepID=A0ABP8JZM3_9MICO
MGLLLVVLLALTAQRPGQPLDPDGPGPEGAMALAEVLRDEGVEVEVVRSIGALEASDPERATTVLVGDPANLGPGASERLGAATQTAGRLVLVGVGSEQLRLLGMPVAAFAGGGDDLVAACSSDVARESDVVSAADTRYLVEDGARGVSTCFSLPDPESTTGEPAPDGAYGAALVELERTATRPQTLVVGFGPAWTNERVTDDSHAGTAVRALGSTPRLVWYQPGSGDLTAPGSGGEQEASASVWPAWTMPATVLLGVAVLALALARGRRLGRLVREPLPVVVRAIETTESRGRLYRRAGDRGRAAAVLRAGSAERLARRLAVPRGAAPMALWQAVSAASGRPPVEVADLLAGPPPPDDTALIHLAQQLTDLEERVRHP